MKAISYLYRILSPWFKWYLTLILDISHAIFLATIRLQACMSGLVEYLAKASVRIYASSELSSIIEILLFESLSAYIFKFLQFQLFSCRLNRQVIFQKSLLIPVPKTEAISIPKKPFLETWNKPFYLH